MNEGMVKIKIMLPGSDWYTFKAETVWAEPLGDNLYKMGNSPFFADNISYHDVIFAIAPGEGEPLIFKSVRKRSGNSTYRIMLAGDTTYEAFCGYMEPLVGMGCSYEDIKKFHFSCRVPADIPLNEVEAFLRNGAGNGILIYEASHRYNAKEEL